MKKSAVVLKALSITHIAHHKASAFFGSWHLYLGILVVIASAILGGSFVGIAFEDNVRDGKIITGALGILAASLAGLQTFVSPATRSRDHHASATTFAQIRRELEHPQSMQNGSVDMDRRLEDVRQKWDLALRRAPNLPSFIHDPVRKNIDKLA